jgi:hypothetical protein
LLRFTVFDSDPEKMEEFAKSIATLILSGPPGVAITGGRPQSQNVMTYYPALIHKQFISSKISIINENSELVDFAEIPYLIGYEEDYTNVKSEGQVSSLPGSKLIKEKKDHVEVKFRNLCLARSGDKGNMVNIGVIARNKEVYEFIKQYLTASEVKGLFSELCKGKVTRYELDNLQALNFLLDESLDGGGTKSLMIDAQGKTFASALLNQKIYVPQALLETIKH